MRDYQPMLSFGEETAARYDADNRRGDEAETVAFLERQARGGPALELAIGTGRIALPLTARGVRVDGIELSAAMLARLRAKPGGDRLDVSLADFTEVAVPGRYRLIYVVFNSFFNLLTQDDQVRCFVNVASRLDADGRFAIEAFVPAYLNRLRDNQYVAAESVAVDEVRLDVGRHDPVAQRLEESHVVISREGVRLSPIVTRYAWPSELDLMARIAGLRLLERWGGWSQEAFSADSRRHVSVYGR